MTNHWIDIRNSDVILIMGSNAAENHPISFKYVTQAMRDGKTVDALYHEQIMSPYPTRESDMLYMLKPLRAG